jgi:branched-chain amino acid transport system permease protein
MSAKTPIGSSGLSSARWWIIALALVWICNMFASSLVSAYGMNIVLNAGLNIILAVSLNLVNGFTGQFSIGHAGFMAVGAYVTAVITMGLGASQPELMGSPVGQNLVFVGALLVGGVVSAGVGWLVGMPSLRLRGDYLAIVTLGFGEIIRVILLNTDAVGGARGLSGIPLYSNFGLVYTFVIITVFCVWRIVNSAQGRMLLAVREDEIAGEAMGVNTTQAKVRAFAIGAFFAGIAGGLLAHFLQILTPAMFDFNRSFEVIIMCVLGGLGSITGSVVAALVLTGLREALRGLQEITQVDLRMIIYSLVLIILMLTRPNGLFGTREITDYLPASLRRALTGKTRKSGGNS